LERDQIQFLIDFRCNCEGKLDLELYVPQHVPRKFAAKFCTNFAIIIPIPLRPMT